MIDILAITTEWTLAEALDFIPTYQSRFQAFNYHIGLAGSVLNTGLSYKDLDIIVMSMCNKRPDDYPGLMQFMASEFKTGGIVRYNYGQSAKRELFIGSYQGKRIDFFVYP
jgi:hypothetical protein